MQGICLGSDTKKQIIAKKVIHEVIFSPCSIFIGYGHLQLQYVEFRNCFCYPIYSIQNHLQLKEASASTYRSSFSTVRNSDNIVEMSTFLRMNHSFVMLTARLIELICFAGILYNFSKISVTVCCPSIQVDDFLVQSQSHHIRFVVISGIGRNLNN